ncbi:SRPBCC family protein [Oceanibacterium hippocampi]|uniref:Carbon monoxide dehydrogenase subunit G (CoxG) n=1 Tax=Oceanibacterium hippocampi TaxID=745714 RepID=A0A1Y5TYD8_9PROT|nr:carbon monoxide dehydrogenase subunit G [Oceanibacterium hippocampi]SLN76916.1 Carbon monoxide dehydrogenase subunit G (CoxG) [Oceanibacterium hippocampi]
MKMTGEQMVPAPRQAVWEALNDPAVLKECISGCEEIEKTSDTEMTASVTAKVGPVKARFKGSVVLEDLDPPNGYTIRGEGKGGAAGFGKGAARVALAEVDGGTQMSYDVEASVGGKLAQIGSRLIDGTAQKMADDFFNRFNAIMSARHAGEASAPPPEAASAAAETPEVETVTPTPPPPAPPKPAAAPSAGGLSTGTWLLIGVVVVALLILVFA